MIRPSSPLTMLLSRHTRRREFIVLLGGVAAWPLAARAQQGERVRRIGVLMNLAADDPQALSRITAFVQGLQQLGWTEGRNMRIDTRWGAGDAARFHRYAEELLALAPDVVLASGTPAIQALQQATRTVPIVFASVGDPVGMGLVASLARPGGNITGFTPMEFGFGAKWLELLKEIAPRVTRVAVLRDVTIGPAQLSAIQAVAHSFGVELSAVGVRDPEGGGPRSRPRRHHRHARYANLSLRRPQLASRPGLLHGMGGRNG
jgi:putative ABC transport system substrate-binding protein